MIKKDDLKLDGEVHIPEWGPPLCGNRYVGMKWRCVLTKGHTGDCDYHERRHVGWIAGHCSDPMSCPVCKDNK